MEFLIAVIAFTGWQLLLFKIAVACILFVGIMQLAEWAKWEIPSPIKIIAACLFCILVIYWLFELFNALT